MKSVDERFPRAEVLRGRKNFEKAYREGKIYQSHHLVLFCLSRGVKERKVGFVTSKKLGQAPTRNRIRRRLREAYRKLKTELPQDVHLVFVARKGIHTITWEKLSVEMRWVLEKAGLLVEP